MRVELTTYRLGGDCSIQIELPGLARVIIAFLKLDAKQKKLI
jgi:hypothetical protein